MKSNQLCLMCRNTGYVVWADESSTTTCYCDCDHGTAAFHRDEELTADSSRDYGDEDD